MKAVVTGVSGFIGSHIAEQLLLDGHSVIGIDNMSGGVLENVEFPALSDEKRRKFRFEQRDCVDVRANAEMFAHNSDVEVLVHVAANAREGASQFQPRSVTQNNLMAYTSILSSAIEAGVRKIVVFSSMAVYGAQPPPFNELMSPAPEDVYGVNKAAMERITTILAGVHGLDYIVLRPHNVFGQRQALYDKMRNVIAIFMNRIMRDEPLFIYGDGEQIRAFSAIEDSLPCFMQAIKDVGSYEPSGQIVNVGGTIPITVNELAEHVKDCMGVPWDYPTDYLPDRPCEVKNAFSTYDKSERLLGYTEKVGWRDGIRNMAEWAKEEGPQLWRNNERLEIINELTPKPWIELSEKKVIS